MFREYTARREQSDENCINGYYKHETLRAVVFGGQAAPTLRAGSNHSQVETVKRVLRTNTADALKEPDPYPKGGYSCTTPSTKYCSSLREKTLSKIRVVGGKSLDLK